MERTFTKHILFIICVLFMFSCEDQLGESSVGSPEYDSRGPFYSDGSAISPGPAPGNGDTTQQQEPGVITAGEWNDLENWDFWYRLLEEDTFGFANEYWGIYPLHNRYSLLVKNTFGQPVVDLPVTLKSGNDVVWRARTDNSGTAEFWVNSFSEMGSLSISNLKFYVADKAINQKVIPYDQGVNTYIHPVVTQRPRKMDVVFVVDATGSMGDELEYLKAEVLDVINTVKSGNLNLELRSGSVFYRDEGDAYVTRVSQLTSTPAVTANFIKKQSADGGGDYPEAVHTAMKDAIEQLNWSQDAVARIMFLVLDAPPHYEEAVTGAIRDKIAQAAERGIKVIPVSASGIDKGTEFLLRFMSVLTNSTYVFITDHSGIGNEHLTPTVGEYEVEFLNKLMVRLINEYSK